MTTDDPALLIRQMANLLDGLEELAEAAARREATRNASIVGLKPITHQKRLEMLRTLIARSEAWLADRAA